jgi:hypothetical protein
MADVVGACQKTLIVEREECAQDELGKSLVAVLLTLHNPMQASPATRWSVWPEIRVSASSFMPSGEVS